MLVQPVAKDSRIKGLTCFVVSVRLENPRPIDVEVFQGIGRLSPGR